MGSIITSIGIFHVIEIVKLAQVYKYDPFMHSFGQLHKICRVRAAMFAYLYTIHIFSTFT